MLNQKVFLIPENEGTFNTTTAHVIGVLNLGTWQCVTSIMLINHNYLSFY